MTIATKHTQTARQADVPAIQLTPATERSARWIERLDPPDDYNFRHYRLRHLIAELLRTVRGDGAPPGDEAPDFDLETADGGRLRLHALRGRPVLMHFVSYT